MTLQFDDFPIKLKHLCLKFLEIIIQLQLLKGKEPSNHSIKAVYVNTVVLPKKKRSNNQENATPSGTLKLTNDAQEVLRPNFAHW